MNIITIDYETFYSKDFSLTKMSTEEYVRHPDFEVIGVAVKVNEETTQWFSGTLHEIIKWLRQFDWRNSLVLAQNCLTGDHEVRTRSGWVRLDQLQEGVEVLQWNPETNESSFVTPSQVIRNPYKGEMLEWDSQFHKGVYTPDHRMYVQTPSRDRWFATTAAEVAQMGANNVYVPMAGEYQSTVGIVRITPIEIRLLEATRADGHIPNAGRQIRFRFTKDRKIERVKALCDTLGIKYTHKVDKNGVTVIGLNPHPTVELIRDLLGTGKNKGLRSWAAELPQPTKEAWCDELKYWDGYGDRITTSNKQTIVHTAKRDDAYWIYEMAVLAGRCAKVTYDIPNTRGWSTERSTLHMVSVRTKTKVKTLYTPQSVYFDGTVYCVTVPTNAFVVRRNGAVWATGNCIFDAAIHQWVCVQERPKGWLDTMGMARAMDGVHLSASLKAIAKRWTSGQKGDEVVHAMGKRRADFTPEDLRTYGRYCINDVELTYEIFNKFIDAGFPKRELKVIDKTIRMFVYPTLVMDTEVLTEHLQEVKQRKADLLSTISATKEDLMSNDKFADLLRDFGVEPPMKISPTTGKETYAFAKTDEGLKELLEHEDERVQAVVTARLGAKSTLEETRTEKFLAASVRGNFPIPLHYFGTITGRWAGADGINMQNIPRGSKLKAAIKVHSNAKMIGIDLSNIELRVGMWLAGQEDKLELFRAKRDLYKDLATKVFNVAYEDVTKDQRQVSKTAALSLIFGTGHDKLRKSIKAQSGTDIGEEEARRIVEIYREDNPYLVRTWASGKEVLRAMKSGRKYAFGNNGIITTTFEKIVLPTGLCIQYPDLSDDMDGERLQTFYTTRKGKARIYGAKVFQQCVQSLARGIMAEILIKSKYPAALTVHDAIYYTVFNGQEDEAFEDLMQLYRTPPSWAPDLPLDAEGAIGITMKDVS